MLTSSDAKWRCMWHMFVWSIQLTLVSQFLIIQNHISFFVFAVMGIIILPILTAVYSNTSGRKGAELLRAGYVFCDPVLACLHLVPVLLLNHMPRLVDEILCMEKHSELDVTLHCLQNKTLPHNITWYEQVLTTYGQEEYLQKVKNKFLVIQISFMCPVLFALLMGRRTSKMPVNTYLAAMGYWLVVSVEAVDLMQTVLLGDDYKHSVFTTEAMISMAIIFLNSYGLITLLSYITPGGVRASEREDNFQKKYDMLYKTFVVAASIFFTEIPIIVARCQILGVSMGLNAILPGTFYLWFLKNILLICFGAVMLFVMKFGDRWSTIPCHPVWDNKTVFHPEKRDFYIVRTQNEIPSSATHSGRRSSGELGKEELTLGTSFVSSDNKVSQKSWGKSTISDSDSEQDTIGSIVGRRIKKELHSVLGGSKKAASSKPESVKKVQFRLDKNTSKSPAPSPVPEIDSVL